MWWIALIPIVVIGFTLLNRFQTKRYEESGLKNQQSDQLKKEIIQRLIDAGIDMTDNIVINGHFTISVSHVWKSTSYYSFLIVFTEHGKEVSLYNYIPDEPDITLVGKFGLNRIKVKNTKEIAYSFIFFDDEMKEVQSVEAYKDIMPTKSEYQIQYPQSEEIEMLINKLESENIL